MAETIRKLAWLLAAAACLAMGRGAHAQCASPSHITSFIFDGHRYEVIREERTWIDAAACAVARGGYLAQIDSEAEQQAIASALAAVPFGYKPIPEGANVSYVWIGATDRRSDGNWVWDGNDDGTGISFWTGLGGLGGAAVAGRYNHWGHDPFNPFTPRREPDNGARLGWVFGENAAAMALGSTQLAATGEWVDLDAGIALYYVVEIPLATPYQGAIAWGGNTHGELLVAGDAAGSMSALSAGEYHSLAIRNGSVVAWGDNAFGKASPPAALGAGVSAVAAGYTHSLALKGGQVYAWGGNLSGQSTPPAAALSGVSAIAAGGYHSLALKNGEVIAWGDNSDFQVIPFDEDVPLPTGVSAIAGGGFHTLVLKSGKVLATGSNLYSQSIPPASTASGVSAIAAGKWHSLALKGGQVIAWGSPDQSPVPVAAQAGVQAIAAGLAHSLALKTTGEVIAWGYNFSGQCTVPAAAKSRVTHIDGGADFSVAIVAGTPTITSVTPASGPIAGGTTITIVGTNLLGATVKVGDIAATTVVVNATGTSLTAKTPAGTVGAKTVSVTTAGGTATKTSAFTYVALPTITTVTPASGPIAGGTTITIAGTNLLGATVKVGDIAATTVVVNAIGTSLTAKTPAGTVGAKTVSVTTAGGTGTKTSAFTYVAAFTGGDSGKMPDGGASKPSDDSDGSGAVHTASGPRTTQPTEGPGAAPVAGLEAYLLVVAVTPDETVHCTRTGDSAISDASADGEGAAGPDAASTAIDLDANGEPDLCQFRAGDLDLNGSVDFGDVAVLISMVGTDAAFEIGDLDLDGLITMRDVAELQRRTVH